MKKLLIYIFFVSVSLQIYGQSPTIIESSGWLETAYAKWQPLPDAGSYNVYYTGEGIVNKKIDDYLIRKYSNYYRADLLGISPGNYTITVKPVISGIEGEGATTSSLIVLPQDRNGFAFSNGRIPGAYKANGTPKDNAIILYITQNSKNTISYNVTTSSNGNTTNYVGFQNIISGIKKGYDTRPYIFRLIGNITDFTEMENGDIVVENKNNTASYITIEGVGDDATANGWGIRVKNATNIEIRNIGFMNCDSGEGDNIGMQQNNTYIWVHNNDLFYGHAGSDADQIKGDGALDNKGTTYATYSYNHFWDSGKSSLLGLSEGSPAGLYVTYHHNWFDHSDSRHPRVRYYSTHIYNNFFDGISKYGSGSTEGSSLFIEGNYFRNAKNPMMISLQGTDVWSPSKQQNDPANQGTFSGEDGGMIKAHNNTFDADIATNSMRFVAYADPNPLYNIPGKINSLTDFDAYVVTNREDLVPNTVKSKVGNNIYNNFDTDASLYVRNLVVDNPATAKTKVIQYSGRVNGGDLKWIFNNSIDDTSYAVISGLKTLLTNYGSDLISIQGESVHTLINTSNNANQNVNPGIAITPIIYTWGGDANDVTVTGLPASGITFVKNTPTKTVTISGIPTETTQFKVTTIGNTGIPIELAGKITVGSGGGSTSGMIHNFTIATPTPLTSDFYTFISANMNNSGSLPSVIYDGSTLTKAIKIESSTEINYTTTEKSTLTLVFASDFTGKIKLDGTSYTAVNGIVIIENIAKGTHNITKDSSTNLYYIKTEYSFLATSQTNLKTEINVYPNPVTDYLTISAEKQAIKDVKIYSISGALVKTYSLKENSIDVKNLNSGVYIISITTNKGVVTKKIIKK